MEVDGCPERQLLTAFVSQTAGQPEVHRVTQHLAQCERCAQEVDSLGRMMTATMNWTAPAAPKPDPGFPTSLGGYKIVKEIGRGAMGRVLLARHAVTDKLAAIKVIVPEHAADPSRLALFIREAAVLSRLQHPRIVKVLDFGIQNQCSYLVLEYVPVINLESLLKRASPADRTRIACRVACLVLEGLEYAHSLGFVHRDVKPGNLLAYRDQKLGKLHIKLADFGLAKSYETAGLSGMTGSRETRGTIVYMAPEQLLDARSVGPACDIYATGATLYRLLTGKAPYDSVSMAAALMEIMQSDPAPVRVHAPHVPPALADVVQRALSRDPAARFPSAASMREALQPFGKRSTSQ